MEKFTKVLPFLVFTFMLSMFSVPAKTQITPFLKPAEAENNRKAYLSNRLQLTFSEVKQYENALTVRNNALKAMYALNLDKQQRVSKAKAIESTFVNDVKNIMSATQYNQWIEDNNKDPKMRNLRENFGLSAEQISRYNQLNEEYKAARRKIYSEVMSRPQEMEQTYAALRTYKSQLKAAVGASRAEPLGRAFLTNYTAYQLKKMYPFMSQSTISQYAKKRYTYDNKMSWIYARHKNKINNKAYIAERDKLKARYDAEIKTVLSASDYQRKSRIDEAMEDRRLINSLQITPEQLRQYKSLMNQQAIESLRIRESRISQGSKKAKRESLNSKIETQLAQFFDANQMARWRKLKGKE